jgi:hypothetical protein
LRAFFAALKEWFETPGFRGCAFQNAAVELANPIHPGTHGDCIKMGGLGNLVGI